MDPVTVVGFVAGTVQLIDVTSKVVNYVNDAKNAPKDRAKLAREATNLLALLTDLRYQVEETTSTDPWLIGIRSLARQGGPLIEFRNAMEDIADKLAPAKGGEKKALRWTLDKKEIEATLSKIERLKTLVVVALQKDNIKLSLALKEEITAGFQEMKIDRRAEKINQWLAAPLPSSNHNTAMEKRQSSTGEWFTQCKEFTEWKRGTGSFLWLHGIPGCGKTILCSTIIQHLISSYQFEPAIAVTYFYFDFNELDKQRTEMLIRSLVVQLAAQCPHLPDSLLSAHSRSQSGKNQPTMDEMTTILRQMVKSFDVTYIVLDALDECKNREDLLEFLEALLRWNIDNLHVLTTSRKDNDIATSLEPLVTCQLCLPSAFVNADIRIHIMERLSNDPKLKKWPVNVRKEIEDALMRGANGMFRWVVCQLDSLRKCLKLDAVRKTLKTLPKTLDETYERILSNLDEEYEEDALKIFQWLCFSMRPMRLDEMVDVLAVDSTSDSRFRPEQRLPDPRDILTIGSTLVSVTELAKKNSSSQTVTTQELRLAHFSVKEYLISDRLRKAPVHRYHISPSAHFSIAKTCLTYLLYFENPAIWTFKFYNEYPLIRYAADFWTWHYRQITDDTDREAVDCLGYNLVESKDSCFINWLNIFRPLDRPFGESDLNLETKRTLFPLYHMSCLGVSGVVRLLLNKEADFNAKSGTYDYALSTASCKGHEKVVRLLLEKGANVNAKGGSYGNALSSASGHGHEKVVRLLLEKAANVNAEGGIHGNALSAASCKGHEKVVRLLLERGANVNAEGGSYGNALSAASRNGHRKVVPLLLEKGADVNAKGGIYGNALSAASRSGHGEVVRMLLEKGADANAKNGTYGNALSAASGKGREGVVRILLEQGANVNAEDQNYGNALSAASHEGHEEMVRLLLEKRANVNAQGGIYGNALSAASGNGHDKVVRLLLEKEANVNAEGGLYGNALSAASRNGHEKVVRLLLEKGANANAEDGTYGNALSAASGNGHEKVVRLLLEKAANVNAEGGIHVNALSAASCNGHEKVVRLLLKKGASVNTKDGTYGNSLSVASCNGHEGVVRLLLEKGANVNAKDGTYGNALSAALYNGHEGVVRLLLEKGADVTSQSRRALRKAYGTDQRSRDDLWNVCGKTGTMSA